MSTTSDSRWATTRLNSASDLPANFSPDQHPILARHWFGVEAREVRQVWWNQIRLGNRLPAEPGVIVLDGAQR